MIPTLSGLISRCAEIESNKKLRQSVSNDEDVDDQLLFILSYLEIIIFVRACQETMHLMVSVVLESPRLPISMHAMRMP